MKGTASAGKHGRSSNHMMCRRCGSHSYHKATGICSSCGFGRQARLRSFAWQKK